MQWDLKFQEDTKTWDLVERPSDKNVIPWKSDGNLEKHKARDVAEGFNQTEGIDYGETFAPTNKPETFRL